MIAQGKKTVVPLVFIVLMGCFFPFATAFPSFPIGLILKYHVDDDIRGEWDEQFEIVKIASEQGDSVFHIEFSSTGETALQGSLLLNSSSWELIDANGTVFDQPLQPPLWVDTSSWHLGETVALPTYSGRYHLSSEYVSLAFGTFLCWQVHSIAWFSVDDDYQQCSENWFFHPTEGILFKYTYELLASQHAIYSYRFSRELTECNLQNYGVLSLQDQTRLLIQSLGLVVIPFIILLGAGFLHRYFRRNRRRQNSQGVSV